MLKDAATLCKQSAGKDDDYTKVEETPGKNLKYKPNPPEILSNREYSSASNIPSAISSGLSFEKSRLSYIDISDCNVHDNSSEEHYDSKGNYIPSDLDDSFSS